MAPKPRRSLVTVVATTVFLVATNLHEMLRPLAWYRTFLHWSAVAGSLLRNSLQILLVILGIALVHRSGVHGSIREIGLHRGAGRALFFALVASLPMLVAFAATSPINPELTLSTVLAWSLVAPLAEEIVYRGYLFGQLHRRAGWGFWKAAFLVAAIFGAGHAYQAVTGRLTALGLLGVVGITAAGSAFFSWLYVRWGFNLWVAVWLHALMNFWWDLFAVDTTALGGLVANVARAGTIIVAIVLTRRWTRPAGVPQGEGAVDAAPEVRTSQRLPRHDAPYSMGDHHRIGIRTAQAVT